MITSVLIVLKHFIYGGTEKYTLNLANELAERGFSVTLISGDGPLAAYVSPKVKLFILPISRQPWIKKTTERKILEIAKEVGAQVIHTQCRTSMICSQLARKNLNIPLVTHEHHMYGNHEYPLFVKELKSGANHIITIGPYTKRKLVKHGITSDDITSAINGVDTKKMMPITKKERQAVRKLLGFSTSDQIVLCISRIEAGKGIDKLAKAFITVADKIPTAKLVIVGDELEGTVTTSFIHGLISQHKLRDRIFLRNGEYDIRKYHAIADIFCYPALSKGMSVMEAMVAGLPVVGKRTNKKPLMVEHGISGLMTEITKDNNIDPDEIAKKLIFLLEKPHLAKKMGRAARERVEKKFSLDKNVNKVIDTYNAMLPQVSSENRQVSANLPTVTLEVLPATFII